MSGEAVDRLLLIATAAAARMSKLLEHVEDSYGNNVLPDLSSSELTARLDAAGHVPGGGLDNCAECQELIAALPGAIAQTMTGGVQ